MLTALLKISMLIVASVIGGVGLYHGNAGAIAGFSALTAGCALLFSQGLNKQLSAGEAMICVALPLGFALNLVPLVSCAPRMAALQWGAVTLATTGSALITAILWTPRIVLYKAPKATAILISLSVFFVLAALFEALTANCGDFRFMRSLATGLMAITSTLLILPKQGPPQAATSP
jgi:hypothetical protein